MYCRHNKRNEIEKAMNISCLCGPRNVLNTQEKTEKSGIRTESPCIRTSVQKGLSFSIIHILQQQRGYVIIIQTMPSISRPIRIFCVSEDYI